MSFAQIFPGNNHQGDGLGYFSVLERFCKIRIYEEKQKNRLFEYYFDILLIFIFSERLTNDEQLQKKVHWLKRSTAVT